MARAANPRSFEVLVVEDNPADVDLVRDILAEANMQVTLRDAAGGKEAIELLRCSPRLPDVILTDLNMPGMGGLELVVVLRAEFPSVPVVLMTAYGSEDIAYRALQKGASGYVPKKDLRKGLPHTLRALFDLVQAARIDERLSKSLVETASTYVLDNDPSLILPLAKDLAARYRRLTGADETDYFRLSVALYEALSNAIYHGNLELSSALRQSNSSEAFHRLARERGRRPPYRDRRIRLSARVSSTEATYVVRDEGPGFNPASTADPLDRANLDKASGRGLFLIRNFMDEVRYNKEGNEITLVKRRAPELTC